MIAAFAPFGFAQDFILGRSQYAVKPAKHRHGQHNALVLRRAIWAPEQVGDAPDEV